MATKPPKETIKSIIAGGKDDSGNNVVHVLATGNEYVIYEIQHPDINNRLRVKIDGFDDVSEKNLIDRFAKVKQKYIQAKGLLYRSSNLGMMKNRVAHALASALSSDAVNANDEFDNLLKALEEEARVALNNRLAYISPTIVITAINCIVVVYLSNVRTIHPHLWQCSLVLLAASLGSTMSILIGLRNVQFQEYPKMGYYVYLGFVRLFLACVAGTIAYILIRAKYVFPQILESDYWKMMAVIIVAAFSETLVPNVLGRLEKKG